MWDPFQYARFSEQRSRPFLDLFHQLPDNAPARIVDLGCGSGELTRLFHKRWRNASVTGVDLSKEMLAVAEAYAVPGRVVFEQADLSSWSPERPVELLFSNAALQWVPDHPHLLPRLLSFLAPGGTLAVQMPANFQDPTHVELNALLASPRWSPLLLNLPARPEPPRPLAWYVQLLTEAGLKVNAWETQYMHLLEGERAVLEWLRGTALRPVLSCLPKEQIPDFEAELNERLEAHYPSRNGLTLLPFRRIFFIGTLAG